MMFVRNDGKSFRFCRYGMASTQLQFEFLSVVARHSRLVGSYKSFEVSELCFYTLSLVGLSRKSYELRFTARTSGVDRQSSMIAPLRLCLVAPSAVGVGHGLRQEPGHTSQPRQSFS